MQQHVLKFNGYNTSEERLLEDVMFDVLITEKDDGSLVIDSVRNPDDAYLNKFSEAFFTGDSVDPGIHGEIRRQVQDNIDHLAGQAKREGKTLTDLLDEWEIEVAQFPVGAPYPTSYARIDLLLEV